VDGCVKFLKSRTKNSKFYMSPDSISTTASASNIDDILKETFTQLSAELQKSVIFKYVQELQGNKRKREDDDSSDDDDSDDNDDDDDDDNDDNDDDNDDNDDDNDDTDESETTLSESHAGGDREDRQWGKWQQPKLLVGHDNIKADMANRFFHALAHLPMSSESEEVRNVAEAVAYNVCF